jgi:hypothetical protein
MALPHWSQRSAQVVKQAGAVMTGPEPQVGGWWVGGEFDPAVCRARRLPLLVPALTAYSTPGVCCCPPASPSPLTSQNTHSQHRRRPHSCCSLIMRCCPWSRAWPCCGC